MGGKLVCWLCDRMGDVISLWFGQFLAKWVIYWVPSLCTFLSGKQKHFLFRRDDFSKPIFPTVEIYEIFYKIEKTQTN